MSIKIIDNFLNFDALDKIKQTLLVNSNFSWYYNDNVVNQEKNKEVVEKYNFLFSHTFYNNFTVTSNFYESIVTPFIFKLKPLALIRIKGNMNTVAESIVPHGYHVDIKDYDGTKHKTAVFYVNSNNGKTIFRDGTQVDSVENRLVIFDGNIEHTGTTCTDAKIRCVLNFNYIEM